MTFLRRHFIFFLAFILSIFLFIYTFAFSNTRIAYVDSGKLLKLITTRQKQLYDYQNAIKQNASQEEQRQTWISPIKLWKVSI
jgi:Skp family chaperone for outer membrane proteins